MRRDQLLDGVARRARLESRDEAERATLATLQTLGEHVSSAQAEDIATGLPDDLADSVTGRSDETPEGFSPDEFIERVVARERTDVDDAEATIHALAVMATLAEAGLTDELQDTREQLANEFSALFETDEFAS